VLYVDGQNQLLGPEQEFEKDEDTGSSANTEDQNSETRSSTGDNTGRWPTKAVNVIFLYQRVWDKDIEQAKAKQSKMLERYNDLYRYSDLTRMCCPTIQINSDLLSMPPLDSEVASRYL
jgi:hypothetical protein